MKSCLFSDMNKLYFMYLCAHYVGTSIIMPISMLLVVYKEFLYYITYNIYTNHRFVILLDDNTIVWWSIAHVLKTK